MQSAHRAIARISLGTLREYFFCQHHVQQVQHMEVVAVGHRLDFCYLIRARRRLAHCILTKDEAQYNRDGVNYTVNYSGDRGNLRRRVEGYF